MFLSDHYKVYFSEQDHEIDHKIQTATGDQQDIFIEYHFLVHYPSKCTFPDLWSQSCDDLLDKNGFKSGYKASVPLKINQPKFFDGRQIFGIFHCEFTAWS